VLLLPQAAVSVPSPTMAMAPAAAARRRDFMCWSYPYLSAESGLAQR
jgi:hypothetical protein